MARRSMTELEGHVRAGAALIVEVLARQSAEPRDAGAPPPAPHLHEVVALLPGFDAVKPIALPAGAPAIGKSLAELDLRARTGASVLAITRGGGGAANPSPHEALQEGDVLALTGSDEALIAAREVLLGLDLPRAIEVVALGPLDAAK